MSASISDDRKYALADEMQSVMQMETCMYSTCTKRQLFSLIGKLSFAYKVTPAGCIFLRRLIGLSRTETHLHHLVTISWEVKLDLVWWLIINFLPSRSGTPLILESQWTNSPTMSLYANALGSDGWGAYWNGRWLQAH